MWRRLRSPFILPFLGASSTTGPPPWILVSPYMKNRDILKYLQSKQGARCEKVALIHQIAQGMAYLHSRDIIHGDFKASNVLVTDEGKAVICDFGLSRLKMDVYRKSKGDTSKVVAGTLRWLSPELLNSGKLTWESDVYAFAMAIYEVSVDYWSQVA
jgi:serine/threonine protein kinase